jgi:arsenate reductase (thioredoxin)
MDTVGRCRPARAPQRPQSGPVVTELSPKQGRLAAVDKRRDDPMRVLFVCVHNSARSQMAEAYLDRFCGEGVTVESAGLDPTTVNPLVVAVMAEEGIDLSGKKTRKVFDLYRDGRLYDAVVTVCEESLEGRCPVFAGVTHRLHLPFPDPAAVTGTEAEKLDAVRAIRDRIRERMVALAEELRAGGKRRLGDVWENGETA